MSYIGNEPVVSATRTITEITATAGQTVFVANGGYTVGFIDVFVNGAQLQTSDFTATNGSTVTLSSAATVGDDVRLVAWGTFSTSNLVSPNYTGTLTGGTDVVNIGSGQIYKDASGNVGIGTSSPTITTGITGLHINNASGGGQLHLSGGGSGAALSDGSLFTHTGTELYINNQEAGPILFYDNGSERMRIDTSGNLLVGTTASVYYGAERLSLNATSTTAGIGINTSTGSGIGINIQSGTSGSKFHAFAIAGTERGSISYNGSGTNYNTSSDYRLKENIVPMTGALDKISALKPCTYTWKETGEKSEGFIAHELAEVVPDCVTGEKDAVDEEGKPVYQGIDTSFLVATLTAAIQELNAKVEAQALEIAALKGNV